MSSAIALLPNLSAVAWETYQSRARSILVPDLEWALNLKDELSFFDPEKKIHILTAYETDLLRNRGPSNRRRMDRIRFLHHWHCHRSNPKNVFIIPSDQCFQKFLPAEFWKKNVLQVKVGEELSRDFLAEQIINLGYMPTDLVETEGQYALRGSLVDIFSPLYEYPVRIELYGNEIQSLRFFHPDSQRKIEDLENIEIPVAREFLYPEQMEALRSAVKFEVEESEWDFSDKEAFLQRLGQKAYTQTLDYWYALIQATAILPEELRFDLCVEVQGIKSAINQSHAQVLRNFAEAREENEWIPRAEQFVSNHNELQSTLVELLNTTHTFLSVKSFVHTDLSLDLEVKESELKTQDSLAFKLSHDRGTNTERPLQTLCDQIKDWQNKNCRVFIVASNPSQIERLEFLLGYYGLKLFRPNNYLQQSTQSLLALPGNLSFGFYDADRKVSFVTDEEIFGTKRKRPSKLKAGRKATPFSDPDLLMLDLKPDDLLVHKEHGIGRYLGLKTIEFDGIPNELLEIEYRDQNKLLIPVTKLSLIQKFSGSSDEKTLDRLGGTTWEGKKSKIKRDLQSLAGELLHLYSLREMSRGPEIIVDEKAQEEFSATFAFEETSDQLTAIEATLKDMRGPKPMDRLLCGDVGYGKTEVAIRAAFMAAHNGFQVAVLVPTTLLSVQHEATFKRRLSKVGIEVCGFSRLKSSKEIKENIQKVRDGTCKVVIGTHKLLSNDLQFKNLGLLVIDEEQKFGVAHKEKIKKVRSEVHVLSMTATPIPRTLNMAMSGLKEMSIITTPPQDRLSVRTYVSKKKPALIVEAVQKEIARGGQVFFVHNRVQTIERVFRELTELLPGVSIEYAHGQMDETKLEERTVNFYEGRTQVLLSTTIIESGLDVPNANTLIVDRADTFGLSQLYQMRGRVGRSSERAYAYFLIPEHGKLTKDAEERLSVLESYQELGSGFHIASHDLDLRGSGDLLGRSQSGQIASIGFDAYVELLQECVAELKGEHLEQKIDPEIKLGVDTMIPEAYIPESNIRLLFYKKLASSIDENEVDLIALELEDRFGSAPEGVKNLIHLMKIKCQLRRLGVKALTAGKTAFSIIFDARTPVSPERLVASIAKYPAHFQLSPDGKLLIKRQAEMTGSEKIIRGLEGALTQLEAWVG